MQNRDTLYRLATDDDMPYIDGLIEDSDIPSNELGFPVIVAERSGEIVGVVARNAEAEDMILIEPLVSYSHITTMRLIESLDNILTLAGVKEYLFRVEKDNNKWLAILNKMNTTAIPLGEGKEGDLWFKRRLTDA